jgi:hypothetical protein
MRAVPKGRFCEIARALPREIGMLKIEWALPPRPEGGLEAILADLVAPSELMRDG